MDALLSVYRRLAVFFLRSYTIVNEVISWAMGMRYYCGALSGDSPYNISVNCDLTVSCNCSDVFGRGQLGDLRVESFQEIFSGKKADSFRRSLAAGRLPIINCVLCSDLRRTRTSDARRYIAEYRLPSKGILVENTVRCNLECLSCRREEVAENRKGYSMSLDDVELVSRRLSELNIRRIHYFNQGEPFISENIKKEVQIIREHNPTAEIITSTNGILINTDEKREAALLFDHIYFSIHGPDQETACRYQRGCDFDKAYINMKTVAGLRDTRRLAKPIIEWKYVLFRWNDRQHLIEKALFLAKDSGVNIISFWPTITPLFGFSYRYYVGGYIRRLGKASWKGREVNLKENAA